MKHIFYYFVYAVYAFLYVIWNFKKPEYTYFEFCTGELEDGSRKKKEVIIKDIIKE